MIFGNITPNRSITQNIDKNNHEKLQTNAKDHPSICYKQGRRPYGQAARPTRSLTV